MYFLAASNFLRLLENLKADYAVYVPVKKGEQRFYRKYSDAGDGIIVGEVRTFEPLKAFYFPARQTVARDFSPEVPSSGTKPRCIVGVKACDLKSLDIQDYVFENHDYSDPFYNRFRSENLIISSDCTCAIETCFCLALGVKPYPQKYFDINLSEVEGGFVAETGSAKAEAVVKQNRALFEPAAQAALTARDKQRAKVIAGVEHNLAVNSVPDQKHYVGIIEKNYTAKIWEDEAATCVECGGCNTVCPTCHCFLLYDQKDKQNLARLRIWDSCLIKDFARVAGGANPRKQLWMRLRNRFDKKFDFFPKVSGVYACTGCGRCVNVCPAKIDIRRVLKNLAANVQK